jgi:hypothetical protein
VNLKTHARKPPNPLESSNPSLVKPLQRRKCKESAEIMKKLLVSEQSHQNQNNSLEIVTTPPESEHVSLQGIRIDHENNALDVICICNNELEFDDRFKIYHADY